MAETDDRAPADDAPRPLPATPPVIGTAPAEAPVAAPARETDIPTVASSLVGEGGLPPAEARDAPVDADGNGALAEEPVATAQPVVADAPDPGPAAHDSGPPPVLAPPAAPARRGGFWPLFFGGVVAAGIGAGATIWALPHLPANLLPQSPAPAAPVLDERIVRADAVAAAKAEVAARMDDLLSGARDAGAEAGTRAADDAIAAVAATASGDPDTAANLEAAQQLQRRLATLDDLTDRVGALESRPTPAEPAQGDTPAPAFAGEIAVLREEIATQAQRLEELAARPAADPAALEEVRALAAAAATTQQQVAAAAAAVEDRLAAAQSSAASVEDRVAEATRRTEALAALASLHDALQSGSDRTAALAALAATGVEAPEALSAAAPSLEQLQQDFPEAARAGLQAALSDDTAAPGGGNMFTNFLRAQTGARSVEPRQGGDPDAILSRAGAAVEAGDIPAALAELATLPPDGRAAMEGWLQGAEAWAAASGALGQVEENLR